MKWHHDVLEDDKDEGCDEDFSLWSKQNDEKIWLTCVGVGMVMGGSEVTNMMHCHIKAWNKEGIRSAAISKEDMRGTGWYTGCGRWEEKTYKDNWPKQLEELSYFVRWKWGGRNSQLNIQSILIICNSYHSTKSPWTLNHCFWERCGVGIMWAPLHKGFHHWSTHNLVLCELQFKDTQRILLIVHHWTHGQQHYNSCLNKANLTHSLH